MPLPAKETAARWSRSGVTALNRFTIGGMGEKPLGPRDLDLAAMTDEDFQQLCHRLVLLEHPEAVSTDNPDGGADSLLPDGDGGWTESWQAKRYGGTIYWSKCKDSLDSAVENYEIAKMTFCFPRNLTKNQLKKFSAELVGRHQGVNVVFWDKDKLLAMLNGSDQGLKIAKHYFGEDPQNKEPLLRAMRAGGELATAGDALERARAVGEFLAGDPFFRYPQVTHEAAEDAPPLSKGTMMSVSTTEEGVTVRIDAIPGDEDAAKRFAPQLSIGFTDDEEGQEAAKRFNEAVQRGTAVMIDRGVEITPRQLPPMLQEHVGETIRGSVSLGPRVPPWRTRIEGVTDRGHETLEMLLKVTEEVPEDWDVRFLAYFGGLTFTVLMRWREDAGRIDLNYHYSFDTSPARDQLKATKFLRALFGKGELIVTDLDGERPQIRQATEKREPDDHVDSLIDFLENVVTMEDWTGEQIPLPEAVSVKDQYLAALFAGAIRERSIPVKWERAGAQITEDALKQLMTGGEVKIVQDIGANFLGRKIPLAVGSLLLPEVDVRDLGPAGDVPDIRQVEIAPPDGEPMQLAWALEPPGTPRK